MSEAKKDALSAQKEGLLRNNKTDETEKPDDIVLSNLDKTDEPHDTRQIIADELKIGSGTDKAIRLHANG